MRNELLLASPPKTGLRFAGSVRSAEPKRISGRPQMTFSSMHFGISSRTRNAKPKTKSAPWYRQSRRTSAHKPRSQRCQSREISAEQKLGVGDCRFTPKVYPRSLKDSNGEGIGDLQRSTSKLDCLHALGIDVIWLSGLQQFCSQSMLQHRTRAIQRPEHQAKWALENCLRQSSGTRCFLIAPSVP